MMRHLAQEVGLKLSSFRDPAQKLGFLLSKLSALRLKFPHTVYSFRCYRMPEQ
jgi:hypothetical protein